MVLFLWQTGENLCDWKCVSLYYAMFVCVKVKVAGWLADCLAGLCKLLCEWMCWVCLLGFSSSGWSQCCCSNVQCPMAIRLVVVWYFVCCPWSLILDGLLFGGGGGGVLACVTTNACECVWLTSAIAFCCLLLRRFYWTGNLESLSL